MLRIDQTLLETFNKICFFFNFIKLLPKKLICIKKKLEF